MKKPENIYKILIAVDDTPYSDQAVNYGFLLAKKLGSAIALVHVNEIPIGTPYIGDQIMYETPVLIPEIMDIQKEASKNLFDRLAGQLGNEVPLYTYTKIGNPKDEILATADECDADMIILGTHGRTGLDHFLSGSIAESVARKAKCPVLIVPNKDKD
ncbi:MAG: universal stress protein [Daejeonella sp.]